METLLNENEKLKSDIKLIMENKKLKLKYSRLITESELVDEDFSLSDSEYFDEFVLLYSPFKDNLGNIVDLREYKQDILGIMEEEKKDIDTILKEYELTYSM